jgi:hypothetical protein
MTSSVELQADLRDRINQDLADRIAAHKADIGRLRTASVTLEAAGAPRAAMPLVLLAHGDSWFDYPLNGNSFPSENTDIVAQLQTMGSTHPRILNLSHHGDATTDEMGLTKQERMITELNDPDNWLSPSKKPDAILFSGGGNDIAGEQFCIFLDYNLPGAAGLNAARFDGKMRAVEASYRDLFAFRDRYAPGVPIFGHSYDYAIPSGRHPPCAGPWLKPSLDFTGWIDEATGTSIVRRALEALKNMLTNLAAEPGNQFVLVDTQGVLSTADWANELHPYPPGFIKLANKFLDGLKTKFPGRI